MNGSGKPSNRDVKRHLEALYDELFAHDGYGELRLEFRILKRGQKEVILHCGKQYRYVVDYRPNATAAARTPPSYRERDGTSATQASEEPARSDPNPGAPHD